MKAKVSAGIRIASMLIDHIIMTLVVVLFFMPAFGAAFTRAFDPHAQEGFGTFPDLGYFSLIGFVLYFCKDCFHGRSIAKRILGLQVMDSATGLAASPLKCFVRNLFCIIWPVEVIAVLINPDRRLGDMVAGTRVVAYEREARRQGFNVGQIVLSIALAYGFTLLLMIPFNSLKESFPFGKVNYIESSYNAELSTALMKLYTDSLGPQLEPDIRVYDRIEKDDRKYVSLVFKLRENYMEDNDSMQKLNEVVAELLHSKVPAGTYRGQRKYMYQRPGYKSTTSAPIP